ncbi:MAG: hypothetical protein GY787_26405, partial [Alteromonadales bacterium]|nr:hypothetical protein [Alteromonadales bacterium]
MHFYITKIPLYLCTLMLVILQGCTLAPNKVEMQALIDAQSSLLKKQQTYLLNSDKDKTNLYFLGIAADYQQNEMFRETLKAQNIFDKYLDTKDRSVVLVNHLSTIETTPIATHSTIRRTLKNIARKMDLEKDILFLYLTAHGNTSAAGGQLFFNFGPEKSNSMTARDLNRYLIASKIKWKIIVVNSCYSGTFIEDLIDPYTLIITSTNSERLAYYSLPPNNFSFFGRAFFENNLDSNKSLDIAFKETVKETQWLEPMHHIPEDE